MTLVFVDVETTGTRPGVHDVWEIGMVVRGHADEGLDGEWCFQVAVKNAGFHGDSGSYRVGSFYERYLEQTVVAICPDENSEVISRNYPIKDAQLALLLGRLTVRGVLVGCNVAFDAAFIEKYMRENGYVPAWDYHLVELESMMAGWLMGKRSHVVEKFPDEHVEKVRIPWKSAVLSDLVGIEEPDDNERHTALGDAKWNERIFDRLMS